MTTANKTEATTTFAEECPIPASTATGMTGEEILTELPEEAVSLAEAMNATSAAPRAVTKPGDDQWDVVPALEPSHRVDEQINDLNGRVLQMESMMHQMLSAIQQLSQPQQPLP
eukprot:s4152_g8.t1